MTCARCHEATTRERLYDLLENDGQVYVGGWRWVSRCGTCGNVTNWAREETEQSGTAVIAS